MNNSDFQTRLRLICDRHSANCIMAGRAYQAAIAALVDEARPLMHAEPEAFAAIVQAETNRMMLHLAFAKGQG